MNNGQSDIPKVTVDVRTLGGTFDESAIDQWELKAARRALKNLKAVAGGQVMMNLLADQIEAADVYQKGLIDASNGSYRESSATFSVRGLSGTNLAAWFQNQAGTGRFDSKTLLLNAHPEHYVEPPTYTGGMVETIDGHLTRFRVSVVRELPPGAAVYADDSYPITLMFAALSLDDGTPFAYCVHQARDTTDGADVVVRVIYPAAAPDSLIDSHCEHLSIEFRSWIRNASGTTR